MDDSRINAAFVTGEHPFDSFALWNSLNAIEGVNWYPQTVGNFAVDVANRRSMYDTLVFYNFNQRNPDGPEEWWELGQRKALETLGSTDQGIVLLHHAILAYPDWSWWSDIAGIERRHFDYRPEATFDVDIVDTEHPITSGLAPYSFTDETYLMDSAGSDSHVLLATDSPDSMRTLAWTRQHGQARVFCYQSGHGQPALGRGEFRQILGAGVAWSSPRTPDLPERG